MKRVLFLLPLLLLLCPVAKGQAKVQTHIATLTITAAGVQQTGASITAPIGGIPATIPQRAWVSQGTIKNERGCWNVTVGSPALNVGTYELFSDKNGKATLVGILDKHGNAKTVPLKTTAVAICDSSK
jgi:hypothetical protein